MRPLLACLLEGVGALELALWPKLELEILSTLLHLAVPAPCGYSATPPTWWMHAPQHVCSYSGRSKLPV